MHQRRDARQQPTVDAARKKHDPGQKSRGRHRQQLRAAAGHLHAYENQAQRVDHLIAHGRLIGLKPVGPGPRGQLVMKLREWQFAAEELLAAALRIGLSLYLRWLEAVLEEMTY